MSELWKQTEHAGYEVSSLGRIRSVMRTVRQSNGTLCQYPGRELRGRIGTNGYYYVYVQRCDRPGRFNVSVHSLVAKAFLPNPEGKRTVNHKDANRTNNCIENLEWATHSENNTHAYRVTGRKNPMTGVRGALHHKSRPVIQILDGKVLDRFEGTMDAERKTGVNHQHISKVCNGIRPFAGGYIWKYVETTTGGGYE